LRWTISQIFFFLRWTISQITMPLVTYYATVKTVKLI
jgi:hypothetical protein